MIGTKIYKTDSKGKKREWKMEVFDLGDKAELKTTAGLADGKQVESSTFVSEGKNIGKANETTYLEQAISQVESKYALQLRKEYVKDFKDAEQGVSGSGVEKPMLAQKYSEEPKKGYKTFDQLGLDGVTAGLQPKLDGNRCLIRIDESGNAVMWTRTGLKMPLQLQHLKSQVEEVAKQSGLSLPSVLDGELFSDVLTFNELNGMLKRQEVKNPELLLSVKFHIYDIMINAHYPERYAIISKLTSEHIELIDHYEVVLTEEVLKEYLERFIEAGHEGLMIRKLDLPYENKRSWQLIKSKKFITDEYEIADVLPDARGGFVGKFVMKAPDGLVDRDGKPIKTFEVGVSGMTHEEGAEVLENKTDYIGQIATVRFDSFSEYGIPRFGKFHGLRADA